MGRYNPDEDWNKKPLDHEEGLELCDEILRLIDEDIPGSAYDRGYEFFESVEEKVKSIRGSIEGTKRFTDNQKSALENMKSGVEKWIR